MTDNSEQTLTLSVGEAARAPKPLGDVPAEAIDGGQSLLAELRLTVLEELGRMIDRIGGFGRHPAIVTAECGTSVETK